MTRPSVDSQRSRTGRSAGSRTPLAAGSRPVGRSSLWDDEEQVTGPQPLKASWDPVDPAPRTPSRPRPVRPQKRRSAVGWFVHRYGWRAYAIPVLVALTILVIFQIARQGGVGSASSGSSVGTGPAVSTTVTVSQAAGAASPAASVAAPAATGPAESGPPSSGAMAPATTGSLAPDPNGVFANMASGSLPAGAAFVAKGKGTWHVVKGTAPAVGSGPRKYTYTIEVEDGVGDAESDQEFASAVDGALADPRSWIGSGLYTLQRVDGGKPSFRISLTSQMTVRQTGLCGWDIHLEASCYARLAQRVAINDARWTRGAVSFNGDLGSYRVYAINHEVGHALGYMHQPCATNGGLAPVMMQQSWSTANDDLSPMNPQLVPMDGKVCRFNPYPFPRGPQATAGGSPSAAGNAAGVATSGPAASRPTTTS